MPVIPADAGAVLNSGFDKVRFLTSVKVGSRLRSRNKLLTVTLKDKANLLVALQHTV